MILSLATGLLVAAATLPFAHYSAGYDWVFLLVPVILVCLHPKVLNPLLNWLFKLIKRPGLEQPLTGQDAEQGARLVVRSPGSPTACRSGSSPTSSAPRPGGPS